MASLPAREQSMSLKSLFGALSLVLMLVGCAHVEPGINPVEPADISSAYVYGNFLTHGRGAGGVALEVKQVPDGHKILIKFRNSHSSRSASPLKSA